MKFSLDTSAYSDFNRGDDRLKKWFVSDNEIVISQIVIGELRAGFVAGDRRDINEQQLQRFLDSPGVQTVSITDATTKLFAKTYLELRQAGTPIGVNDMWIAAISLEHTVPLLTTDTDFSNVSSLELLPVQA